MIQSKACSDRRNSLAIREVHSVLLNITQNSRVALYWEMGIMQEVGESRVFLNILIVQSKTSIQ